jgi:hypothetical protein
MKFILQWSKIPTDCNYDSLFLHTSCPHYLIYDFILICMQHQLGAFLIPFFWTERQKSDSWRPLNDQYTRLSRWLNLACIFLLDHILFMCFIPFYLQCFFKNYRCNVRDIILVNKINCAWFVEAWLPDWSHHPEELVEVFHIFSIKSDLFFKSFKLTPGLYITKMHTVIIQSKKR